MFQGNLYFQATLGELNSIPQTHYQFKLIKSNKNNGNYPKVMRDACNSLGTNWKPVCGDATYCKNDGANSVYIGQTGSITNPTQVCQDLPSRKRVF